MHISQYMDYRCLTSTAQNADHHAMKQMANT